MTPPPDIATIRPFLSPLLLKRAASIRADNFLQTLSAQVQAIAVENDRNREFDLSDIVQSDGIRLLTIEYVEYNAPSWAPDSSRMEIRYHIVLIATKGDLAAVCASQSGLLSKISKVPSASLIDRTILERAFVGTSASVIWLNGIHDKTDAKPTAKTLMGTALEHALDPLGDQSFLYSAMRSTVNFQLSGNTNTSIGTNPGCSRVWVSRPPTWADFVNRLERILDRIATPPRPERWFEILARSLNSLNGVKGAFEIGFVPPELLENGQNVNDIETLEGWAFETEFEITSTNKARVYAKVTHKGDYLGKIRIVPEYQQGRVLITADWRPSASSSVELLAECISHLENSRWTKIRYTTGHIISQGGCYINNYRDQYFDWKFLDLARFNVTKEKPVVPSGQTLSNLIGASTAGNHDDSLFGYVYNEFRGSGWLASDDGSMEIADFIHIGDDNLVTLIHVKAAASTNIARQVSATKYEVVVGQAIKNIRHLDRAILAKAFLRNQGNLIGSAVWHAGVQQVDRNMLIDRVNALPPGYPKRVVILHPQLTKTEHDVCNSGGAHRDRTLRMKQLHTLMLAARLSAGAVGATLEGWAAR